MRRVTDSFVGNTEAADILGVPAANVEKTLRRKGVESQILKLRKREMRVYLRDDVERVGRERRKAKAA